MVQAQIVIVLAMQIQHTMRLDSQNNLICLAPRVDDAGRDFYNDVRLKWHGFEKNLLFDAEVRKA